MGLFFTEKYCKSYINYVNVRISKTEQNVSKVCITIKGSDTSRESGKRPTIKRALICNSFCFYLTLFRNTCCSMHLWNVVVVHIHKRADVVLTGNSISRHLSQNNGALKVVTTVISDNTKLEKRMAWLFFFIQMYSQSQ